MSPHRITIHISLRLEAYVSEVVPSILLNVVTNEIIIGNVNFWWEVSTVVWWELSTVDVHDSFHNHSEMIISRRGFISTHTFFFRPSCRLSIKNP